MPIEVGLQTHTFDRDSHPDRKQVMRPEFFEHLFRDFDLPLRNPVLVFALILFIILLSPILLKRLNIPGIIGLIISGVIIGPHALNILEKNSAVDLFSTIGLLYIMFIAGLELNLNEMKANRNKSILFGAFTFFFPLLIGFPVCYFVLGYNFDASFLTASMFATHTLVAYPIVSKFGISKHKAVAITVGGTILTDTAVLIILAVILSNSQGNLNQEFWIRLIISLALFSGIIFGIIPRLAKWFFRKLESEKHSHYIFVLSVVFFAAFLAEAAGVEPIIGAFMAGLALNRLIPPSSALMNRIEFIGNSLFIPFFLISVGMIVDVSVILKGPEALIVAATLTVVALFGKWMAAFVSQLVFRYSGAQRQLIFGLSSAHAAATLAVILVGYKANILDEKILNGTIILILVTCIVASFATEKAARRIVLEANDDETPGGSALQLNNEHILLPLANIENIDKQLEFSIFIKDKKSPNPVSILSVVSNNEEAEINIYKAKNKLEEYVKQGSASGTNVNIIATIDHNPAFGIMRISREIMATIIVLGWPKRVGFLEKLTGDKVENILSNTDKTTFVCDFEQPLVAHKRIVLVIPPLAERELGFELILLKITKLSEELSIPIKLYSNEATSRSAEKVFRNKRIWKAVSAEGFDTWEDFLILARDVSKFDLFVLISARKGSVAYMGVLESLPEKLEKHFPDHSKIVIYPQQHNPGHPKNDYQEISFHPINKGIETIQKIGKDIGSIFKKNEEI